MFALLIRQRVSDIGVWKRVFEEDHEARMAYGALGYHVFRQEVDPDEIVILIEWDDPERARLYGQSDDLRELLARSGSVGHPAVWILDDHISPSGHASAG
jgi:quinol monooxygenase YgiN